MFYNNYISRTNHRTQLRLGRIETKLVRKILTLSLQYVEVIQKRVERIFSKTAQNLQEFLMLSLYYVELMQASKSVRNSCLSLQYVEMILFYIRIQIVSTYVEMKQKGSNGIFHNGSKSLFYPSDCPLLKPRGGFFCAVISSK